MIAKKIEEGVKEKYQIIFIESICNDKTVVENNIKTVKGCPECPGRLKLEIGLPSQPFKEVVPANITVDDDNRRISAFSEQPADGRDGKADALSTFGSFSSETSVGTGNDAQVKLGIFFATGVAAQTLSEGFRCALASKDTNACSFTLTKEVKVEEK